MEIGGEIFHLRFSDQDVAGIERAYKPIHQMFMPITFGFDMARIFLWKGLKKEQQDGTLIYAFTQDAKGFDDALQGVKKFTGQFNGPAIGLSLLYDSVDAALVASGWYSRPSVKPKESERSQVVDPTKNSQRPMKRPTRKPRMESAISPPTSSGDIPLRSSECMQKAA